PLLGARSDDEALLLEELLPPPKDSPLLSLRAPLSLLLSPPLSRPKPPPLLLPLWSPRPLFLSPASFLEISTFILLPSSWQLFRMSSTFSLCSASVLKKENPSLTSTL